MSEEQETSTGTGINKLKILLVDDDSEFCKQLTTRSLTFKSLEITSVDSIEGAKEKINTDDYEAYFVGENLSDGKGIEFIKYLREEEKTKGKYLAYLTLSCKDVSSFQIIKSGLGVDLILHKPVNSRNIHYLLDQVEKSGNESEVSADPNMQKLRDEFEKSIFDRLESLEKLIQFIQDNPSLENMERLRSALHKTALSSGSFGFHECYQVCSQMEMEVADRIEDEIPFDAEWGDLLKGEFFPRCMTAFQKPEYEFMQIIQKEETPLFRSEKHPDLFLVSPDLELLKKLKVEGEKRGLDIIAEEDAKFAWKWLVLHAFCPTLLIINSEFPDSEFSGYDLINAYKEDQKRFDTTIGFICGKSEVEERLKAVEMGVEIFIERPVTLKGLLDVCELVIDPIREDKVKVLVVDDDKHISKLATHLLREMDFDTKIIAHGKELFDAISTFGPDLVLLDLDVGKHSGLELLSLIRGNYLTKTLPIMIVTKPEDTESIVSAYASGIEGHITKPINYGVFQSQVANFAKNRAAMAFYRYRDPVTGLVGKTGFSSMFEMAAARSDLNKTPMTMVIIQIDKLGEVLKKSSAKVSGQLLVRFSTILQNCMRKTDLIGRWNQDEFIVLMENTDLIHAQFMLGYVLEKLYDFIQGVEFLKNALKVKMGISGYPENGPGAQELEICARKALKIAEDEGSDKIVPYYEKRARRSKILVLEPNKEAMGKLIWAFERRGFMVTGYSELKEILSDCKKHRWAIMPTLVICDQRMGCASTEELLAILPKEFVQEATMLITISQADKKDLSAAVKKGFKDFIRKPYRLKSLMELASTIMLKKK